MTPADLIGAPAALEAPAPWWFLVGFKVLGFVLHMVPMNLWYVGILLAVALYGSPSAPAKTWSKRLMLQMPLFIALGVNFGIVPLLFTQVAYHRVFYPATILMAWTWLALIGLLALAYYGVYIYGAGLKSGVMPPWRRGVGWLSAALFLVMGFIHANAWSLMTRLDAWPGLRSRTTDAGAVLGTAHNLGDPTFWPRWLMMIALSVMTVAAHAAVDAALFARAQGAAYRGWALGFARRLAMAGAAAYALVSYWYVFGTWRPEVRAAMITGEWRLLTWLTALAPLSVLALLWARRGDATPGFGWWVAGAQLGVLALNGVSRQVVQYLELRPWLDPGREAVRLQWSPLVVFLVVLVIGAGVVAWMVRAVVRAGRSRA